MQPAKNIFMTALLLTAFSVSGWAQHSGPLPSNDDNAGAASSADAPAAAKTTAPTPTVITAADVQALKDALAAQQQQIDRLNKLLELQQAQQSSQSPSPAPRDINVPAQQVAAISTAPVAQQGINPPPGGELMTTPPGTADDNPMHSPVVSIHFKGITITPGGFAAAEFVRRSRALGADVTTPFNSLTMPGASQSQLSEFFGSARQSRPTIYVDGRAGHVQFSSYLSGDFLSSGDTSTNTQTDSYTLRLRQVWGQVKFDNGWSFLGGQMWSLVTENKESIAPSDDIGRTNDARPMTIDPGYNVGFSFARQYGIRLTKDFNHKFAFAVAMENAQGTLTTHNNVDNFLLGQAGATNTYNDAVTGCTASTYTPTGATAPTVYTTCALAGTYTYNPSPDVIVKLAFDPGFGHYEVFGLWDRFRDRVFPCANFTLGTTGPCPNDPAITGPSAVGAYNASRNAGGFGANARWRFDHNQIVFGLHAFGGNGIGRYGSAQLSDMAIHADGTPDPIRDYQGLGTLEWHGKKLDVYLYGGAEYAGRTQDYDPATKEYVGYGSPHFANSGCYVEAAPTIALTNGYNPGSLSKCTADTRVIMEGTAGFWYRFYNGPRGRFQFGTQYSYITRNTWYGTSFTTGVGAAPTGLENEVFTSFRYYLP